MTGFPGVAQNTPNNSPGEPPDPYLAVGPDDLVQAVNLFLRITDRNGAAPVDVTLPDFFLLPTDGSVGDTDPRVLYDPVHGRWVAIEASWDCSPTLGATIGHGYLDVAISDTANPRLGWTIYYRTYTDMFPDYPGIGTSTDKVAVSTNLYNMVPGTGLLDCIGTNFRGADLSIFDWPDLINGGALTYSPFDPNPALFTIRPAIQAPPTSPTVHLIMYVANGGPPPAEDVEYGTITGTVAVKTIFTGARIPTVVSPPLSPNPPHQPGSPATIVDAIDERITDAVWQANKLTFVATYPCTPTGDTMVRDCVRVTQLNTTGAMLPPPPPSVPPTLFQDFLVAENGKDSYMGGIGISANGALHVIWTRSSATAGDFASTYGAYQLPSDPANSLSAKQLLAAGDATYPGTRWGDYVGVPQDPQDPNAVWQADEYSRAGTPAIWATTVTQLATGSGYTYVPIDPVRVLYTPTGVGLSGTFNSNVPRTFQVAGADPTIPLLAKAITGNLTVTGQTAAGYVSVTVSPTSTPSTSTLNFPVGDNRANNVTMPLSPTGMLSAVYRGPAGKSTHLILDVTGYFRADDTAATYHPMIPPNPPVRIMSTVAGVGLTGKFQAGIPRTFQVTNASGPIPLNATAISGNLTVTAQSTRGYVAVTPDPTANPQTSTLNFPVAENRANGLTVRLSSTGSLAAVYKSIPGATTDLILDVTGYYTQDLTGLHFYPLNPGRRVYTPAGVPFGILTSSVPRTGAMDGHEGVPPGASAITGNLTVLLQTQRGYISITPDPTSTPDTSTINFPFADIRANGVTVPVNGSGAMSFVFKSLPGKTTHVILDVSGYFK